MATFQSSPLDLAFKQFSLETERLDRNYQNLQERFQSIQTSLQDSHMRISGKLAELDFLSHYLETILHHISQGILFIDCNGIVTTYNPAAQKILQIPQDELLFHPFGKRFEDHVFGFSLQEVFTTKQSPQSSFVSWNRQGQIIELEIEATFVSMNPQTYPVAYRQTESHPIPIQGLLIILRDITKLRKLQEVANRHDRLKDLGELAAHLAHEIRNPLGGIKGFATLLYQELKERSDLQQMASYIIQGSDELNEFVSQVLQYARPHQLHLENIDVVHLIEDIKQLMLVDQNWNSQIDFSFHSPVTSLIVPLDAQLVKSALLNIFVNAAQAMPNGGHLVVKIIPENAYVTIRIEDTGIGIPPENISKIFSPFFTTKETGNGLGLAEVHKIIQAHQGWIEVESKVGMGSVFTLKFPLKIGE